MKQEKTVVVLGASPNPERYSYKAVAKLLAAGFNVLPVHPASKEIQGLPCKKNLAEIRGPVHTISVYINADRLESMLPDLLAVKPQRIIFNPGTENKAVIKQCQEQGIEVILGCTLVMLSNGQF